MAHFTPPPGWPADKPLAVCFHIMCEAYSDDAGPGVGPMGNPLKAGYRDTQAQSWARYGMTVGAWRLLDIVAEAGIPCNIYASGMIAERWPDLLRRIDADGHPIGAHGWAQDLLPVYQDRATEEADLLRGVAAFEGCYGKRPMGFISPRATNSEHTLELLAAHGFRWTADVFDSDLPYRIETSAGPLAAVPFTVEVNDLPIMIRHGNEPAAYTATLRRMLEGWDSIGRPYASIDVTAHAHLSGRPAGAIEYKAAIEMVKALDWAWITTHERLADTVLERTPDRP